MAVQTTMTNNYIKPADAISRAKTSKNSGAIGYTDRGTAIVNSNTELGQNAFLNILVAELSNMDPTQDQDSTAYVTQMAEFASIEQLNNLNTTMKNFSYQQMVGQVAILSEKDDEGNNKFGLITQVFKEGSATYATIQDASTGEYNNYDINKIIGTSDSGYTSANFETALNSSFLSASSLANANGGNGSKAVVVERESKDEVTTDRDGNTTTTTTTTYTAKKCVIKSAYLDKQNSQVKVTVAFLDDDGNETDEIKVYNYNDVVIAGEITDEEMNQSVKDHTTTSVSSRSNNGGIDSSSHALYSGNTKIITNENNNPTDDTDEDSSVNSEIEISKNNIDDENKFLSELAGI